MRIELGQRLFAAVAGLMVTSALAVYAQERWSYRGIVEVADSVASGLYGAGEEECEVIAVELGVMCPHKDLNDTCTGETETATVSCGVYKCPYDCTIQQSPFSYPQGNNMDQIRVDCPIIQRKTCKAVIGMTCGCSTPTVPQGCVYSYRVECDGQGS